MPIRKGFKVHRALLADHIPTPFLLYSNGTGPQSVQTLLITKDQLRAIRSGVGLLLVSVEDQRGVGLGRFEELRALHADLGGLLAALCGSTIPHVRP